MSSEWIDKTIGGRYKIEALLGQGGMSAVYRASDPNLRRLVAIKLIHPHLSTDPQFVGRFKEEAAAVARLRHPNIVQVHDFDQDGETYYMVMEYLVGETLQSRLRRLNSSGGWMPLDEALELTLQICAAAGYAHRHELVHRDIKPANIMLTIERQAVLMDFGIVKIVGGDYHTATGATLGTAMYMSPEQILAERVDDRTDIYSLGVTLYEMLSGRPPYLADSAPTLIMMVLNDPLADLRSLRPGLPESLVALVNCALEKEPARRFHTMDEMAAALRQVQAELVEHPMQIASTQVETGQRFIKAPASPDAPTQKDDFDSPQTTDRQFSEFPTLQDTSKPLPAVSQPASGAANGQDASMPSTAAGPVPIVVAPVSSAPRAVRSQGWRRWLLPALGLLVLVVIAILTGIVLLRQPPGISLTPISLPPAPISASTAGRIVNIGRWQTGSRVQQIAFSPVGWLIGTAENRDLFVSSPYRFFNGLWQVEDGRLQRHLTGQNAWVTGVAFSPDGQFFASCADDGRIFIWRTADGSQSRIIERGIGSLVGVDFSPNNLLLAAASGEGKVGLWQADNGNLLRILQAGDVYLTTLRFSPDGAWLAAGSGEGPVYIWQVSDGELVFTLQGHTGEVHDLAFMPDGSLLASASEDTTLRTWQISSGSLLNSFAGHTEPVYALAFSPDGSLLASAAGDGTLRLWEVTSGQQLSTVAEQLESIETMDFSPDGLLLVTGGSDGVLRFWGLSEAIQP